jgi:PAS domain S-box-containing protein
MGGSGGDWERLFWLVFERSTNPIWLIDEQRRIVKINGSGAALLGRPADELTGTAVDAYIRPDERAQARAEWERFVNSADGYSGVRTLLLPGGSTVTVDFAARFGNIAGTRLAVFVSVPSAGVDEGPGATEEPGAQLSDREREVVTLIAMGLETPEIAGELHISPATVRTHVRNAMAKLGVHTRAQLVAVALCGAGFLHSGPLTPAGR